MLVVVLSILICDTMKLGDSHLLRLICILIVHHDSEGILGQMRQGLEEG